MPNCVSLCIKVNNVWGLIRALAFIEAGNSAVVQPLDPFGGALDSVAQGNVEVGYLPIIDNIAIRGSFELVFVDTGWLGELTDRHSGSLDAPEHRDWCKSRGWPAQPGAAYGELWFLMDCLIVAWLIIWCVRVIDHHYSCAPLHQGLMPSFSDIVSWCLVVIDPVGYAAP